MRIIKIMLKKIVLCGVVCSVLVVLSSCTYKQKEYDYYSVKDNYVCATGKISHIKYNEQGDALYLAFENLQPEFSDTNFKIIGDNLVVVKEKGIDEKIRLGVEVEFISAPRYFGDGYVMPIVGLSIDGEELLKFEDGYENLMKWLE